jgi:hypothetical protein
MTTGCEVLWTYLLERNLGGRGFTLYAHELQQVVKVTTCVGRCHVEDSCPLYIPHYSDHEKSHTKPYRVEYRRRSASESEYSANRSPSERSSW